MEPDVVVVGGGAIGVTAAYELARRGARVTLLERGETLASGCSGGNAGLICPSHSLPLASPAALREGARSLIDSSASVVLRPRARHLPWLARFAVSCGAARSQRGLRALRSLSRASLDLHVELAALGTSFEQNGILGVYLTDSAFAAARDEAGTSGLGHRVLSGREAAEIEPSLRPGLAGALLHPEEAHVDPLRYVRALGTAAASAGADLRTGVEVRAVRPRDGRLALVTTDGELRPETVVLAAGAWTARLARGAGVVLPLTGGKGYHVDLEAAAGDPRLPILIPEARSAVTPLEGRLRLTGTLEVAGLDPTVRQARVDKVRRAAAGVLRETHPRSALDVWAGLRPCTPDGLPILGRPTAQPSLVIATGHAMKGIALAPVTARLVAELVAGELPSHDLSPFSPERFRPLLRRRRTPVSARGTR